MSPPNRISEAKSGKGGRVIDSLATTAPVRFGATGHQDRFDAIWVCSQDKTTKSPAGDSGAFCRVLCSNGWLRGQEPTAVHLHGMLFIILRFYRRSFWKYPHRYPRPCPKRRVGGILGQGVVNQKIALFGFVPQMGRHTLGHSHSRNGILLRVPLGQEMGRLQTGRSRSGKSK